MDADSAERWAALALGVASEVEIEKSDARPPNRSGVVGKSKSDSGPTQISPEGNRLVLRELLLRDVFCFTFARWIHISGIPLIHPKVEGMVAMDPSASPLDGQSLSPWEDPKGSCFHRK